MRFTRCCQAWLMSVGLLCAQLWAEAPTQPVPLWPGAAPGDGAPKETERDLTKPGEGLVAGRRVIRLGNVWTPTLTINKASPNLDTGASVLVCPGGGYHILALDLEGTEVCQWLNSIGVTGVLLRYRVPRREGREKHEAALQDAQRALGLMRQNADSWGLDPQRMGVLGFSAGGHLAAALSNNHGTRSYPSVDAADQKSCRPDFAILVYPAYLTQPEKADAVAPELPISTNTPPTWTVITQDDPVRVENALGYVSTLQRNKVPAEFHLFPKGGHGYGLRRTDVPVTRWTDLATEWLQLTVLRKR